MIQHSLAQSFVNSKEIFYITGFSIAKDFFISEEFVSFFNTAKFFHLTYHVTLHVTLLTCQVLQLEYLVSEDWVLGESRFFKYFFYLTVTLKTAAFVTCWTLNKWGNARPYSKSRKKRTLLGRLWLFGKGKNRFLFGRLWNAVITSRHKMEMKYSDKGTLVQRQRYPLPSLWLQYWPMNHCVRNTTSRRSVFENIFDNCFVIIGNGEFNHTGIKCRGGQNDANPDFQETKTEEKKSKAERKSEKHYHFNNCTFNFKEPQ